MAIGMTKCEMGAKIHNSFEQQPGTTICLDYSKYDTTISAEMIRRAFVILATWFSRTEQRMFGWETVIKYFIHTPIVMPDGNLYVGKNHGVPSGSYFTQLIDSVVNVALCYALSHRFGFEFSERGVYVLGDDSIMKVRGKFSLPEMAKYLAGHGLILHDDDKTVVGEEHFLGAFWKKGKPDSPLSELTKKAVFPETFRDYEGKPSEGAEDVLRNYATSYLSAWKLVPNSRPWFMVALDKPGIRNDLKPKHWSASDRFFFEEYKQFVPLRRCEPTISLRFLL
jgi:hypothetical protein